MNQICAVVWEIPHPPLQKAPQKPQKNNTKTKQSIRISLCNYLPKVCLWITASTCIALDARHSCMGTPVGRDCATSASTRRERGRERGTQTAQISIQPPPEFLVYHLSRTLDTKRRPLGAFLRGCVWPPWWIKAYHDWVCPWVLPGNQHTL